MSALDSTDSQTSKGKFRLVGRVVMAMQRFQASINPTYTYGKQTHDAGTSHDAALKAAHAARASGRANTADRTASGRTISGRPTSAGQAHGHKGSLLFRPLPEVETPAQ
ncbi:MAG: hypothetical protein J3K34DRAFT_394014 [Monoraphidium minutum]|nr:MAG: hypothetical protein J3K34DRAFT_394014 [Monoraphidium minutum]